MEPVIFIHDQPFLLESGITLPGIQLAYHTYGQLNASGTNAIWVFHALTANANVADWWSGLFGAGNVFNAEDHFIICVNMPGSCYGSIGPLLVNTLSGQPFYHQFPLFTIRDIINSYQLLQQYLGITSIHLGIGGSMGGQQLLEWAITAPQLFKNIVPIATNAKHSAWGIAFNASQRMGIEADPTWQLNNAEAGINGMKLARSIALLSYRNYDTYQQYQSEDTDALPFIFKSESYQRYQGVKLARRFNAFSYYFLSKSMDAHNVGRGRSSIVAALASIKANTMVIGIETDILFPLTEQQFLAQHIPNASIEIIHSTYGHDGFLLEFEQIKKCIRRFLKQEKLITQ